ncbi:MAG: hypothetical protein J6Y25_06775 [Elusimicrobiaceae bacterium]|nr:hypothetical protein [Elusimicrobiaceae bacterium]
MMLNTAKQYPYVIFSPYFGKLPNYFELWARSCSNNKKFLFIVFTDCQYNGDLPENVLLHQMEFTKIKEIIQKKLNFPISLDTPYKLCDYKPCFGYLFQEYLNDAKYWGHCDMDLIFGNIEKFLPNKDYDKISHLGHLCLYKNIPSIREAFKLSSPHPLTFKEILSSPINFAFDEIPSYGINAIFAKNNLSIFPYEKSVAEISPIDAGFVLNHRNYPTISQEFGHFIFTFEHGKIYKYSYWENMITKTEVSYIHLQKRQMKQCLSGEMDQFLITRNSFLNFQHPTKDIILSSEPKHPKIASLCLLLKIKRKTAPKRIARIIETQKIRFRKLVRNLLFKEKLQ